MFVNVVTIQWAGTPVFLVAKPCLLAEVLDCIRTTLWGRVWIKQGKLDLQTLIIFTGYIVSACTSQTLLFGYMRSTWLKSGSIFHKPVLFVGFTQTCILVDIISYTQQKSKSSDFIWIFFLKFYPPTFYHFFCTCNMHYKIEQHGGKDKSMYPQIVRSSQDFAVFMTMPFVLY